MAEKTNTDVKTMPFETAIAELEQIVRELEGGKVPLEQSVTMYERGEALKARCEELLKQAEARVEKITLDAGGKPTGSEPLDVGKRNPRVSAPLWGARPPSGASGWPFDHKWYYLTGFGARRARKTRDRPAIKP